MLVQLAEEENVDAVCFLGRNSGVLDHQFFDIAPHIIAVVNCPEGLRSSHWLDLSYYYEKHNQIAQAIRAIEPGLSERQAYCVGRYVDLLRSAIAAFG